MRTKYSMTLLKSVTSDYTQIHETELINWYLKNGYIAASEPFEIDFTLLPTETIVTDSIKQIDAKIQKELVKSEITVQDLKKTKQKLLALPPGDLSLNTIDDPEIF